MKNEYDFSGWATRNGLRCSDGRVICKDAFKDCDGMKVPLVWNHQHNDPSNILGHAILENRDDGVYTYGKFNDTEIGQWAKELVKHGDISSLSIYANHLKQNGSNVLHGAIREVSLVLAGANPGAFIDTVMAHSDGEENVVEEAIIYTGDEISLSHSDNNKKEENSDEKGEKNMANSKENEKGEKNMANSKENEKTVDDVINELTEEQKAVVAALIGQAVEDALNDEDDENENEEDMEDEDMKHNCFENENVDTEEMVLSHSDIEAIFSDAKRYGSLSDACLEHGITNIEYLFPDAQNVEKTPDFIKRDTGWVSTIMNSVRHTPFSRIKSTHADITAEDARAKGYVKGRQKVEEVISLLKRTTDPQTIYKKQKLDRDDMIDITDFDVVSWIKSEMRIMLDEEIARAVLVGDGRLSSSNDKIDPTKVRPIWTDDSVYSINKVVTVSPTMTADEKAKAFIRAAVKSRVDYKGSGNPVLFTTEDVLTDCLLMEDNQGRVIYETVDKLKNALRVTNIVTVPVMENLSRTLSSETKARTLLGIIVNLKDYTIGADKGGAVNMFDDFDIDYNAQKYLIETRCSGALTKPYSAIVLEAKEAEPSDGK